MARYAPIRWILVQAVGFVWLALAVALVLPAAAQSTPDGLRPLPSERPHIGATVRPSKLVLPAAERTTHTRIGNAGSIPATVHAVANLPSTRVTADGWRVTVDALELAPGEWATVTLTMDDASPSDISLDVLLVPRLPSGSQGLTLRFPIPVDVQAATVETAGRAWSRAILRHLVPDIIRSLLP